MSRLLLHPLKGGGSLTRVPSGGWEPVKTPDQLLEVDLRESGDRSQRGRISSVPSPWARLQVFRDAILDPGHPFREEALNDVLDTLELLLFQRYIRGLELRTEQIAIDRLVQDARASRCAGVVRFVEALRDLAPVADPASGSRLGNLTVAFGGPSADDPILFATSPYTLFFTPEGRRDAIPGYYEPGRRLRPLSERPTPLAQYIRDQLLPQLDRSAVGDAPELQELKGILRDQLARMSLPEERPRYDETSFEPVPGVVLHRLVEASLASPLALRPTRPDAGDRRAPLVLDNSGRSTQESYFPWLPRPLGTTVDAAASRKQLPGTAWKYEWIFAEADFFTLELLVLDAPLAAERVYGPSGDRQARNSELLDRILLPLTEKFFEFFRPEDVPDMLSARVLSRGEQPEVEFTLTIPTAGRPVTVQRTYGGLSGTTSHLSLWPGFRPDPGAFEWHDYYLIHYLEGGDAAEEIEIKVGAERGEQTIREVRRDLNTVVYHFDSPPEVIRMRSREFATRGAEGVVLPRLRRVSAPSLPAWTIAIDFGTSNTVVAYRDPNDQQPPQPLAITHATRFDLTRSETSAGAVATYFDTFFFPAGLEGRPFATVILKSRSVGPDDAAATVPALTANIPFRGDIGGSEGVGAQQHSNELIGDLKWGGGGADSARLTRLFLHQILQVVHAEALTRGVRTEGMQFRVSYPIAFSLTRQAATRKQWQSAIRGFHQNHGPARGRPAEDFALQHLDESSASMLYFQNDPASQANFTVVAHSIKLTADVGGGTTDVSAYARGKSVFRMSMLFGGRDLIADLGVEHSISRKLLGWAQRSGLPRPVQKVLQRYPTEHTRFTYLVRQPWFADNQGTLAGEPWFMRVQACIVYFFSTILYNIGLRLRTVPEDEAGAPDVLFFAGNGAGYLNWLTQFESWNESRSLAAPYSAVLQQMLEAGYGRALAHPLMIRSSSRPKLEVVLGLLSRAEDIPDFDAVPSFQPLGEHVSIPGAPGEPRRSWEAERPLDAGAMGREQVVGLAYELPIGEWEITRFNRAFADALQTLSSVDPKWPTIAGQVRAALAGCTANFFDNHVKGRLAADLLDQEPDTVSLFSVEAAATLHHLERTLLE